MEKFVGMMAVGVLRHMRRRLRLRADPMNARCWEPVARMRSPLTHVLAVQTTERIPICGYAEVARMAQSGLPDVTYSFTPSVSGDYVITMPNFADGSPSLVSLHTDCADTAASCLGGQDFYGNPDGSLVVNLDADIPVFIVVDSFSSAELGAYSLKVDLIGNSCENPILVDAGNLPYSYVGDNTGFGDSSEQCRPLRGVLPGCCVQLHTCHFRGVYLNQALTAVSKLFSVFTTCGDAENSCVGRGYLGLPPDEFTVAMDAEPPISSRLTAMAPVWEPSSFGGAPCVPQCTGLECGDDGCGGYGTCAKVR